jgi:phosphoglycerate dehydrogenase-like enzyme
MTRVLILMTLPKVVRDVYEGRLRQRFPDLDIEVVDHYSKAMGPVANADVLLTFGPMMHDDVFRHATRLKWVQALGTGVDGIVDQPSIPPGVTVTAIRGIHGAPVSEAAMLSMLALARDFPRTMAMQAKHAWTRLTPQLIDDKTVGIYGVGLIAEALAPRCKAFGMRVVGFSSSTRAVPGFDRMYLRSEFVAVAHELDFFVLLVPYGPDTHRTIGAREFAAMKPTAYFVNVARGGIVDEDALIHALETGQIAGAALDVFQTEPLPSDHPLWTTKNVIVTPHLGGFCDVYAQRALPTIEHNMACFLHGDIEGMVNRITQ